MVHPLSSGWHQPSTDRILINDEQALMDQDVFDQLAEYSMSYPSGVYEGKIWKRKAGENWLLCWYANHPSQKATCVIYFRTITILAKLGIRKVKPTNQI